MSAVLFDLDGTLADTLADIAAALNAALGRHGLPPHDLPTVRGMIGDGARTLVTRAIRGEAEVEAVLESFRTIYTADLIVATAPYPGVPAALAALAGAGVPMAVVSNKPHAMTVRITGALFPDVPFGCVLGDLPERPRKPAPDMLLYAAARLGVAPERCVYVGDSPGDMEAARAAGMAPVGVAWGFRSAESLRAAGAAEVLAEAGELCGIGSATARR